MHFGILLTYLRKPKKNGKGGGRKIERYFLRDEELCGMKGLARLIPVLFIFVSFLLLLLTFYFITGSYVPTSTPTPTHAPAPTSAPYYNLNQTAENIPQFQWIKEMMDKYHKSFDVYTDVGSGGNHFPVIAKMAGYGSYEMIEMDECFTNVQRSHQKSATYIKANFNPQLGSSWGGSYFMSGVFPPDAKEPKQNWGDYPNAGFNLKGATKLTFFARGEEGGEQVEFFVGGMGWPDKPYKESFQKASTGYVTLSKEWKEYSIDLRGKDLCYVLSGFGWVTNAQRNLGKEITFYIDDIRFDLERPDELRFIVSYDTLPTQSDFDKVMRNTAFAYDNALALIVFLASGTPDDLRRAEILADAFVYASQNDRFYDDGRLRNAYSSGDLKSFPGWKPNNNEGSARLPGFWDCEKKHWFEDEFAVSIHTGNVAWVMIALISAYERLGKDEYLSTAEKLGEWVEQNLRDNRGEGGYLGGFQGWEPKPEKLFYKSTEHNLDLYVAFIRLYELTKEENWKERALHAKRFILAMWDEREGKFWAGTKLDGVSINKDIVPLDVQAWAILVFKDEIQKYVKALRFAENHHAIHGGFDFDTDRDGIWYEGTAQMAVAYQVAGEKEKAESLLGVLEGAKLLTGAIPAASRDGLTTGFDYKYFHRGHLGATAWYLFAKLGVNPYWVK